MSNSSFQQNSLVTLAAIGSSANANGATLSNGSLTLQPASASFGGVLTTGTQTIAGTKTFSTVPTFETMVGVGSLFTQTADKTVTNTVTETSIVGTGVGTGLTLPANFFVAGRTVRIMMSGVYSTVAVTGDTVTIKVKYGSTVVASQATTSLLAGATNLYWAAEMLITCRTTGSSGTVQPSGSVRYQTGAAGTTVENELNNSVGTATINTTTSNLLDITVTHSAANASNTVKSIVSTWEVLN